jgi:uncharacterized protein
MRDKQEIYKNIVDFLAQEGASEVSVFGSFARNEEKSSSDIDILVEFERKMGLIEFCGIERRLSDLVGRKVDLLTKSSLSTLIEPFVENDRQIIYQKDER